MCVCSQGLGLYAARDIEKCTMVIEYIGTIIRSEVANRKERLYESQVTHRSATSDVQIRVSESCRLIGSFTCHTNTNSQ